MREKTKRPLTKGLGLEKKNGGGVGREGRAKEARRRRGAGGGSDKGTEKRRYSSKSAWLSRVP